VLKTRYGTYDGNSWEEHCQILLKLKYEEAGYQEVVAHTGGDLGIEGYTRDGIVFQCYCPNEEYPPKKLYEEQRDKVTGDLNKLRKFKKELKKFLGTTKIKQWIFLTPLITNKDLISHCKEKANDCRNWTDMTDLLDENFDVLAKDEDYFVKEILIAKQILGNKLDFHIDITEEQEIINWKESESETLQILFKKVSPLFEALPNQEQRTNKFIDLIINDYIMGRKLIYSLEEKFPLLYEKHFKIKNSVESIIQRQILYTALSPNQFMEKTMNDFKNALESEEFTKVVSYSTSDDLCKEAIADWLIRCPLDFGGM
jgi:hypothetical protein